MRTLLYIFLVASAPVVSGQTARSVMVNSNGVVVAPTNFWANAPAQSSATAVQLLVKPTNSTFSNATNLITDENLTFIAAQNSRYIVSLFLIFTRSTAFQIVASNATVFGYWNGLNSSSSLQTTTTLMTNERISTPFGNGLGYVPQHFVVTTTNSSSTVSLHYKQSTPDTNTNIVHSGTWMRVEKLPD